MQNEFNKHIDSNYPSLKKTPFLLACSGGIDSVVLAHLCATYNLPFAIAHCNFNLRGDQSTLDEDFVTDLAKQLNVAIYSTSFNTKEYVATNKVNIQVGARELRYRWFSKIQKENGLEFLLTAHHADDDLETFLINLSRGSGIDGLIGMPKDTDTIKRPLTLFSQKEILAFATNKNIIWREDQSNADTKYLRNNIRHKIVPLLKELHPNFLTNFKNTQTYLRQTEALANNRITEVKQELFVNTNGRISISISKLQELKPLEGYIYALFKSYGFTEWNNVRALLTAMSGKELYSKTHRLLKDRTHLILTEINKDNADIYVIKETDNGITEPVFLQFSTVDSILKGNTDSIYVDKQTLKFPLTLRKWKKGDYFYPFGMKGKKKIAKYFKDEKYDLLAKEKQWLLCSDDKIVWILGKRADDRFKVTNETKNILKFEI